VEVRSAWRLRARRLAAGVAATLGLGLGCALAGSAGCASRGAPPLTLRASDSGRTVHVANGGRVDVTLRARPGFEAWRVPSSGEPSVVRPDAGTQASFTALRPGTSTLQSDARLACPPQRICPALAQAWTVVVIVDRR
jgi:hypothetical protein